MDLDAQLSHFHVGHYEEHADQLDSTMRVAMRIRPSECAADGVRTHSRAAHSDGERWPR